MESLARGAHGVRTKRKGSSDSVLLFWGMVIHFRVRICNASYGPSGYHDKYLGKDFLERISSKRTVCLGQKIPPEKLWVIYQRMELIQAGPQCWVRIHEKRCSSHRSTPAQLLWQVRGVCSAPQDKPDVHTLIFCLFSKCQDAACNLGAKKLKRKTLALST